MKAAFLLLALMTIWTVAFAQRQAKQPLAQATAATSMDAGFRDLPRFEVATIKPQMAVSMQTDVYPDRVVIKGQDLKGLIMIAFSLNFSQISGGEDWSQKDTYDIEAKMPESEWSSIATLHHSLFQIDDQHLRQMLQALLIDRFKLKFHVERSTANVYFLELSGRTLRLARTKATVVEAGQPQSSSGGIGWAEGWVLSNVTMPELAHFAGNFYLHRPVLDRTTLTGAYNYRSPHEDSDSRGGEAPDSFVNMIHEVGLKLEPGKAAVDTFVIDKAEKPSPN